MMSFVSASAEGVCPAQKKCFGFVAAVDAPTLPVPATTVTMAAASTATARAPVTNDRADPIESIPPHRCCPDGHPDEDDRWCTAKRVDSIPARVVTVTV